MRVIRLNMVFALLLAAGAVCSAGGCSESMPDAATVDDPAPTSSEVAPVAPTGAGMFGVPLRTLDGTDTTLAAYEGRPMLIEVWATWCGPCRRVRTVIAKNRAKLAEVATVVGVSVDQGGGPVVKSYLEKSPTPGMLEFLVTNQFRSYIAPLDVKNTIPKLIYVHPDGRIANISYGVSSPSFMLGLLRNLQPEEGP